MAQQIKESINSLHNLTHTQEYNNKIKSLGLEPDELNTVFNQFDLKPGDLTLKDRELRIKYLKKLVMILNNNVFPVNILVQTTSSIGLNEKYLVYIKNIMTRMCYLFIKEAEEIQSKKEFKKPNYLHILLLLLFLCIIGYFIYINLNLECNKTPSKFRH